MVEISNEVNEDLKSYRKVTDLLNYQLESQNIRPWSDQFKDACKLQPSVDQNGKVEDVTITACLFHLLSIGWKVLFAVIPPKNYRSGYPTFLLTLVGIAFITAIIREFALILACTLETEPATIGMTLLAVGMNISDVFALRRTAKKSPYVQGQCGCDQTIGFILASISVNIYLGFGIPWMVVVMCAYQYDTIPYLLTPSDSIGFSSGILVISIGSVLGAQLLRRWRMGGELGSKSQCEKSLFGLLLIIMWILFILISLLKVTLII